MIQQYQLISLSNVSGVGPRRIRSILRRYPNIDDITKLSKSDICQVDGISSDTANKILNIDFDFGKKAVADISNLGGEYFTFLDDKYPKSLKTIWDAPVGIFTLGKIPDNNMIAVVGTRLHSDYGKKVTETLSRELLKVGFTIVSGFARGIDTITHRTTLKYGGSTIAVLGNGPDVCYPSENKKLRNEIIKTGAIISEFVPKTPPDAINFPKRNRIISGLSLGTIVIEAGNKSGAIITALNALDQNREVFAIPGKIDSKQSVGCHRLIQQGAKLVTKIDDILEEINIQPTQNSQQFELIPKLSAREESVYKILTNEPLHIDKICEELKEDAPEILSILLMLELKNLVTQHPGKLFSRA